MDFQTNTHTFLPALYHITPVSNIESILQSGLIPQIGARSESAGEKIPAIYLFSSVEDAEQSLLGWLGEEFEDEDIALLEIRLLETYKDSLYSEEFEIQCRKAIPPKHIRIHMDWGDGL